MTATLKPPQLPIDCIIDLLQEEIANLNAAEEKQCSGDKKSKPGESSIFNVPLVPGKKIKQEQSVKTPKEMESKSRSKRSLAPLPIKLKIVESIPQASTSRALPVPPPEVYHPEQSEQKVPKVSLPKNTFWASMELYCAEISDDDIQLLDYLID